MQNRHPESQNRPACAALQSLPLRRAAATRHLMRNALGEIESLATTEVVVHANEILQLVEFPSDDLDALASGYVDVWNSAFPDQEVGLPGRAANDLVGDLIGYAFMLTRVRSTVAGGRT